MVGTGDAEQFDGLDLRGVAHVRAGAQVEEFAVAIKADGLAVRDVGKAPQLVGSLSKLPDVVRGFLARALEAFKLLVLFHNFFHLRLDAFQIFGRELVLAVKVVIKPRVRRRPDVKLRLREQAQDGSRKNVRGGMADLLKWCHHGIAKRFTKNPPSPAGNANPTCAHAPVFATDMRLRGWARACSPSNWARSSAV